MGNTPAFRLTAVASLGQVNLSTDFLQNALADLKHAAGIYGRFALRVQANQPQLMLNLIAIAMLSRIGRKRR